MKNKCFAYKMQMEAKYQRRCRFLEFVFDCRLRLSNTYLYFNKMQYLCM